MSTTASAEIAVISHPDNPLVGVSVKTLTHYYLGKRYFFSDGSRVMPIDQRKGSTIRSRFYTALNLTEIKLNAYWAKRTFSGKSKPPKILADDGAVIGQIINTPGAIGYIDGASLNDSVKVLLILP